MLNKNQVAILRYASTYKGWVNFAMEGRTVEAVSSLDKNSFIKINKFNQFEITDLGRNELDANSLPDKVYKKVVRSLAVY